MSLPAVLTTNARNEDQSLEINTEIVDALYHSAKLTRFEIPKKNIMDSKSSLIFSIKWTEDGTPALDNVRPFLNRNAGGLVFIRNARLLINGRLVANLEEAGKYLAMKNWFKSHDSRVNVFDTKYMSSNDWSGPDTVEYAIRPVIGHQVRTAHDKSIDSSGKLEVEVRLDEIFAVLRDNQLPTNLLEGKIHLEIDWEQDSTSGVTNMSNAVTWAGSAVAANVASMKGVEVSNPRLLIDFLTYNDAVEAQLRDQMNTSGMVFRYREVALIRKHVAPATYGQKDFALGMTNRAVQKIFVAKTGLGGTANQLLQTNRSDIFYKEKWNCRVNNLNIFDRRVDNYAEQFNYLQQAGEGVFHIPPQAYERRSTSASGAVEDCAMLGSVTTLALSGAQTIAPFKGNSVVADISPAVNYSGHLNYIGIDLAKYRRGDEEVWNALRIGSTPILFSWDRTADPGGDAEMNGACQFYIWVEYLRQMRVQRGVVEISDM